MRLFFAAWPELDARQQLESVAAALRLPQEARRVPAQNYHLTLAFAGEVSNAQGAALRAVGAALRSTAFAVCLNVQEHWQKSEVVVVAARDEPPALRALHQRLRTEFDRLGLAADPMPFRAHVTIARRVVQAPVLEQSPGTWWRVRAFHLVHSARSVAGSVYTVVDTWPLLDTAARAE
jgi:RNA 2',3'-cyclic 3'-phosphodiesterase